MKTVLVIGAGKFGSHLAIYLCEMGNEVMLVDREEERVAEISHLITATEIGDYTVKSNIAALGVEDYDYCFVCVGNFQDSLVIVDYLKELGATCIIGKATSSLHEKFLRKNGADKIIYPERDIAYNEAVEYSNDKVLDFFKISNDAGVYEINTPESWCGKSLITLNVRRMHGVTIIASKDSTGNTHIINSPDYVFNRDESLFVVGTNKDVSKLVKKSR